jgi:hypothetical protein
LLRSELAIGQMIFNTRYTQALQVRRLFRMAIAISVVTILLIWIIDPFSPRDANPKDVLLNRVPPEFVSIRDLSGPLDKELLKALGYSESAATKTLSIADGYMRTWIDTKERVVSVVAFRFEDGKTAGLVLQQAVRENETLKAKSFAVPGVVGAFGFTHTPKTPNATVEHVAFFRRGSLVFRLLVDGKQSDRALVKRLAIAQHRRLPTGAYRPRSYADSFDISERLTYILPSLIGFIIVIPITIAMLGRISGLAHMSRSLLNSFISSLDRNTDVPNMKFDMKVHWPESTLQTVVLELPPLKLSSFRNQAIYRPHGSGAVIQPRRVLTGHRTLRVTLLLMLMLVSLVISFAVFYLGTGGPDNTDPSPSLGYVLPIPFLVIAAIAYRGARRYANLGAHEVLLRDTRPLVLLLRSFKDDYLKVRVGGPRRRPWLDSILHPRWDRFEEVVAWNLWQHGPVVAPSLPGQRLQPLGAARARLSSDAWQEQIIHWMTRAKVIVIVLGRTHGLSWEISKIVEFGLWHKTLLVVPPISYGELRRRWSDFRQLTVRLGVPVPDIPNVGNVLAIVPAVGPELSLFSASRRDETHYQLALKEGTQYMPGVS